MRFILLLSALFVSCSSGIDHIEPNPYELLRLNAYIESLSEGKITEEIIIQGSVTSSDSCGNFYQSMIIQDPTGAMELRFSFYDIFSLFKIGDVLSVKLINREIKKENGLIYANMGSFAMVSKNVIRQGMNDKVIPRKITIPEIDLTVVGKLVEISGGTFAKGGDDTWSGEQKYNVGKNSLTVYTSPFASYANNTIPYGTVSLRGIITLYKDKFQIKMNSSEDCKSEE